MHFQACFFVRNKTNLQKERFGMSKVSMRIDIDEFVVFKLNEILSKKNVLLDNELEKEIVDFINYDIVLLFDQEEKTISVRVK